MVYPFKSNYLDLNGLKYHYLDEGDGPPIVMVHGNPTWSFYYRNLVRHLSPVYRTIVPDHMGCGLSDKPGLKHYDYRLKTRIRDFETMLEHLNLKEKLTLVLHDWGGAIGMGYAVRRPDKIGRIILLNTAAFLPPNGKKIPIRLKLIKYNGWLAKPALLGLNLFSRSALYMASFKGLSMQVKRGLTAPYNSWKNRIATLTFVQDIPVDPNDISFRDIKHLDENLHTLSHIPMMICWGKHDFVFDLDYLNEWQRRFPGAEVHLFEDAGHYILEDVPEKIIERVDGFLKRHPVD